MLEMLLALSCYLSAHMSEEAKIAEWYSWETCVHHLAIKGTQNKPYAFSGVLIPSWFISTVSHLISLCAVLSWKHPFMHFHGKDRIFTLSHWREDISVLSLNSTPHILSLLEEEWVVLVHNHSVVPLKILSLVSFVSSLHCSWYQSTYR